MLWLCATLLTLTGGIYTVPKLYRASIAVARFVLSMHELGRAVPTLLTAIKQLVPNSGTSMLDRFEKLEKETKLQSDTLTTHSQELQAIKDSIASIEGKIAAPKIPSGEASKRS